MAGASLPARIYLSQPVFTDCPQYPTPTRGRRRCGSSTVVAALGVNKEMVEISTHTALALQVVKEMPFGQWRQHDAEDTVRFFALRLREAGIIKSTPQKIIAQGTDWRFINELKKELKG